MRARRVWRWLGWGMALCLLVSGAVVSAGPTLHLQYATFDPLASQPILPISLKVEMAHSASEPGYYLIQFDGPIQQTWRQTLIEKGMTILDYIPDYAYLVRASAAVVAGLEQTLPIRWSGLFQPGYRLSRDLYHPTGERQEVMIQVFRGEPLEPVLTRIKEEGGSIVSAQENRYAGYVRAIIPTEALVPLANVPAIGWIEPYFAPEPSNDVSREIMNVHPVWQNVGLYGAGQIAAVADTGFDKGDWQDLHADFAGRLVNAYALGRPPDDWSDMGGHGTHVAGSILASGAASGSQPWLGQYANSFAGVAPQARLVFQSLKGADGKFSAGIPDDLNELFLPPYQDGARVHNNSWGGTTGGDSNPYGGYVTASRQADEFVWDHKDMTILYSVGNPGADKDKDGVVDLDSTQYPATAKNVIGVGATENDRPSGGYDRDYGDIWPDDYPERPISNDHVSNDPRGVVAFSARGPTDDGRIKPDVVAPGTNIISTRARTGDATGWGVYNDDYIYMGGTSMATPLTSGAAVLVRERYARSEQINASAALVKATLINGADNIAPGQYPVGPCQEVPDHSPNPVSGWGRVNLAHSIAPTLPRWIMYTDQAVGLQTGQTSSYSINLAADRKADGLRVLPPLIDVEPDLSASNCQQFLAETGFEQGGSAWSTEGNVWVSQYAHHGNYSAWLGSLNDSDDWLWQTLHIPADATAITLSFWYAQDSEENYCGYDYFWVGFYDYEWDSYLTELLWQDGRAATDDWAQKTITLREEQLAAIRGRYVHLAFQMYTDGSAPSGIRLDDVLLTVCNGADDVAPTPLRVTLVWSDYPGSLSAAKTLVNDLDLEVVDGRGRVYHGNGGPSPDRLNTTEDVVIAVPQTGSYQIHVRGHNVAMGPQPFALVVSGGGSGQAGLSPQCQLPLLLRRR